MSEQHIITHSDFTNLLASGAFVRDGLNVVLLSGPFTPLTDDKKQEISIFCPDFYEAEKPVFLRPSRFWRLSASDFSRLLLRRFEEGPKLSVRAITWTEPDKTLFQNAFARIQNLISEGQIDKAVPVVFAKGRAAISPEMKVRWMLELMSSPEHLYPFGWWDGDEGIIGTTPEVLFDVREKSLRTMALAGTLAKADGTADELARSTKDQHEHALVIEDLKRELKNFGLVRVGSTSVLELPALYHLRTPIEVDLEEPADVPGLLKRLHPTAALGVFPRVFGWRWMSELPGQENRRRFGAPFVIRTDAERVLSLVAIRCMQWSGDELLLGSGCGIVKNSDFESEWRELFRKRASVLSALGIS